MTEPTDAAPLLPPDPVLGAVMSYHPSDRTRPLVIAAITGGALSILLNFTVAAVDAWWSPPLTVIFMGMVALGLAWYVLHGWNREIVLFERGLSYREGSTTVFLRYDEIDALRLRAERRAYFGGLIRRTVYRFTVHTRADETFIITNLYRRVAELGERLTERVNAVLIPRVRARLAAGESVAFGAGLAVSRAGLRVDGRDLAWDQFGGWAVKARALHLKGADGSTWAALPLTALDNITLLVELLRERGESSGRSA